jgi:hypothetical protein
MKNKHTQGKWEVKDHSFSTYIVSGKIDICQVSRIKKRALPILNTVVDRIEVEEEAEQQEQANAKLIASSPQLLETLTNLLASYKKAMGLITGKESNAITVIAEAVIKEATE